MKNSSQHIKSNRIRYQIKNRNFTHYFQTFLTLALFTTSPFYWALPTLANTAPGTTINNTATGSFEDPDNLGIVTNVESNTVSVTVAEVAGITITQAATPEEAPSGVSGAGANQGNGTINPDDIIYFTYKITNVGNDPTQFVIPDAPSNITNGSLNGSIQIIEYDPDGASPVDLTSNNITVPNGGATTGTLLNGIVNTNDGSVPVGGSITIRVPIKASSTLSDGDRVTVVMGDTGSNDNSAGTQNQVYAAGTNDVYTEDNPNGTTGETDGSPIEEREASLSQEVEVAIADSTPTLDPNLCPITTYLIQGNPSNLSTYNLVTGQFGTSIPISGVDSGTTLNAVGFNPLDGNMYAMEDRRGNKDLYRLDQAGNAVKLGNLADLNFRDYNAGDVDANGYYYISLKDRTVVEIIDVNPARTATYGTKVGEVTLPSGTAAGPDLAINPVDGRLYTIRSGKIWSFEIDVATETVTDFTDHGRTTNVSGGANINITAGAVYFDVDGNFYAYDNPTGNLWKFQTNPTVSTAGQLVGSSISVSDNDGARCAFASVATESIDYGDAPDSYGTTSASNGASHTIVSGLHLGTAPDAETDAATPLDGSGDGAEDDGITLLPLTAGSTGYAIAPADITATGTGTLHAWIDFDKNGTFEPGEYTSVAINNGTSDAEGLSWSSISVGSAGNTYARFRFTTDSSINANTPGGAASDGEVEDYQVEITQAIASDPNVLLVKRITKVNGNTTTNGGDDLSIYNQEDSNPYDDNKLDNPAPDPIDTDKWFDTTSDTSSGFLIGGINGGKVEPNDELEYTIYFLSAGDAEAKNVLVCDRVPGNVTFIADSFNNEPNQVTGGLQNADRGILWLKDGNTESLTNAQDGDVAQYFPPGIEPSTVYPQIQCDGTNTNGAIVVNLGNLPNATAAGTPNTSYGYIRFKGRVK